MQLDLTLSIPDLLESQSRLIGQRIQRLLPKAFDAEALAARYGGTPEEYDTVSLDAALADPLWHYLDAGGKRWRPALMLVAGVAVGVEPERLYDLAAMCEMIHNATLLADDIEDESLKRRGRDAAHVVYGVDAALNAGNALYFLPQAAIDDDALGVSDATRLKLYRLVNEEMVKLHCGQAMDIAWGGGKKVPTVAQYLRMCAFKTGTLARMAARIAAVVGGAPDRLADALGRYAESIGVAFQIQDDILNVTPSELADGKGFGDDIHEGKASLLVIYAMNRLAGARAERLAEILQAKTHEPTLIEEAVQALRVSGAVEFARDTACRLVEEAWAEAEPALPKNGGADKLREFGRFVVERDV